MRRFGRPAVERVTITIDEALLEAIAAGRPAPPGNPAGRMWEMAGRVPGADPLALAACLAGVAREPHFDGVERCTTPALLFAGADDDLAPGAADLAAALRSAELLELEGRDHRTALGAAAAKRRAVEFLA
jgi:pimeloyl-ACP methyl ester carboxylesterase